jgi:hypothetical protein
MAAFTSANMRMGGDDPVLVTPGSDHATRSASWRLSQERTVPLRITSLPLVLDHDAIGIDLSVVPERLLYFLAVLYANGLRIKL